ncbi:hypothetical protein BN13_820016 [Nostocoides jenkinsii Ben 74]|uniref:Uncharacterized protein n=1 Tax=Nostocoides jenkinsii Ben 74 TaxID=1193518 RepID=A0A077MFD5_9MICO|nr:hypothetical protein BN13_820016 [Tetrasphaera jenkinsii Ben 74]
MARRADAQWPRLDRPDHPAHFGGTGADRGNKGDDASRLPGVTIFRRDLASGQLTTRVLAGRYYVWGVATSGTPARLVALVSGERHAGKRAFRLVDLDPATLAIRQEIALGDHGWGSLGALPGAGASGALVLRTDDNISALDLSKLVPGATTDTPGLLTEVARGWSPVVLGDGAWSMSAARTCMPCSPACPSSPTADAAVSLAGGEPRWRGRSACPARASARTPPRGSSATPRSTR